MLCPVLTLLCLHGRRSGCCSLYTGGDVVNVATVSRHLLKLLGAAALMS